MKNFTKTEKAMLSKALLYVSKAEKLLSKLQSKRPYGMEYGKKKEAK